MPRLIWVFAGHTVILLVLSWGGSYMCKFGKQFDGQEAVIKLDLWPYFAGSYRNMYPVPSSQVPTGTCIQFAGSYRYMYPVPSSRVPTGTCIQFPVRGFLQVHVSSSQFAGSYRYMYPLCGFLQVHVSSSQCAGSYRYMYPVPSSRVPTGTCIQFPVRGFLQVHVSSSSDVDVSDEGVYLAVSPLITENVILLMLCYQLLFLF